MLTGSHGLWRIRSVTIGSCTRSMISCALSVWRPSATAARSTPADPAELMTSGPSDEIAAGSSLATAKAEGAITAP